MKTRLLLAATLLSLSAPAWGGIVAGTWNDNRVHLLDDSFNDLSSFAVGASNPNGIATDGTTIWVGLFTEQSVWAFNFSGVLQYTWSDGVLSGLQGLELVGNELAAYSNSTIYFFDPVTGAPTRNFAIGDSVEGLAYDGSVLYGLGDEILKYDPVTGDFLGSIASAGSGCGYGGTGLASLGGGKLGIGCDNGEWFIVSSADGSVLSSGNNGLAMFGLGAYGSGGAVPEPGSIVLFGLGAAALAVVRRRRATSTTN